MRSHNQKWFAGAAVAAFATTLLPAQADQFADFRQGDLVFQETSGPQSIAVKAATGSPYTHVGMVRLTSSGPVIIEAERIVTETPLSEFIARGKAGRFSVYRLEGLTKAQSDKVIAAARKDYGKPYDLHFRLDPASIYCSELPYRAFKAAGAPIGVVEKVGSLKIDVASAVALIDKRWRQHPDCKDGSMEACMAKLRDQDIVTPVGLTSDGKLTKIYSNF